MTKRLKPQDVRPVLFARGLYPEIIKPEVSLLISAIGVCSQKNDGPLAQPAAGFSSVYFVSQAWASISRDSGAYLSSHALTPSL
jgi:hypothetical protein